MPTVMSHIGHWAQRIYQDRRYQNTKGHRVESEIGDRVVTHCGRQLQWQTTAKAPNFLRFTVERPENYCSRCQ